MRYLLFLLMMIVAVSCAPKKQPQYRPGDTDALRRQMTRNHQLIDQTNTADSLIFLYRRQVLLAKQANDLPALCSSHQELYNLLSDNLPDRARPHLDSIIHLEDSLRGSATGRYHLALAYGNRYYWYEQEELNHKVVADCEKYLQYASPATDSSYLSLVLKAAGIATSQLGDQQQSVIYLEKLLKWERHMGEEEAIASAAINLANSYNNIRQFDAALQVSGEALQLKQVSPERRSYLHALQAQVYLEQENFTKAGQASQQALALLQPLTGADSYDIRMSVLLKVHADVLMAQQQEAPALRNCYRSLEYLRQVRPGLKGRDAGKTCIALARLHRRAGRYDSSLSYCNMALLSVCDSVTGIGIHLLPHVTGLHPENTIMEALDEKAGLLEAMATTSTDTLLPVAALQCFDRAFEVETQLRRFFIYDNSKYLLAAESKARSEAAIRVCLTLERHTKRPYWAEQAFAFAEKSKAGVLLDKIRENLLAAGRNDSAFIKAGQLQLRAARLEEQLASLTPDSATATRRAELEAERDRYLQLLARYKTGINTRLNNLYEAGAGRPPSTTDIAKRLKGKTDAVLEFFSGDSLLYVFLLDPVTAEVKHLSLRRDEVEGRIRRMMPFLHSPDAYNNNPAAYRKLATDLWGLLLQPLLGGDMYYSVMTAADGMLGQLPLAALQYDTGPEDFLLKRFNFIYVFSCASLLQQMDLENPGDMEEMAFFAPFIQSGKRGLPALPQSVQEQQAIGRFAPGGINLAGNAAVKQAFLKWAPQTGLLHVASHAYADGGAGPRIEFADSSLSLNAVYALPLRNQLVVLSACHTGAGNMQQGEGVLSLARGFYYAGARNVISSLWEADDRSAGLLFTSFYNTLKAGAQPGRALQGSQLQLIETATAEKKSPYYWASFVCMGDGGYTSPNAGYNVSYGWAGMAAVLLLTGILWWRAKNDLDHGRK